MLSDQTFLIGIEDGIRLQARASKSPIYFYYFTFKGSQSYSDHLSRTHNNYGRAYCEAFKHFKLMHRVSDTQIFSIYYYLKLGVCHTDDFNLVLENPDIDPTKTTREQAMSNLLMDMWKSVATSGFVDSSNM